MNVTDWHFYEWTTSIGLLIGFLVAIGTIALATVAFKTIRHTSREYRNRQLNEILEWAESAREYDFTKEDRDRLGNSKQPWAESYLIITSHSEIVMNILRTGYVMSKVALVFNRKSLDEKIKGLMTELLNTHVHLGELRGQINFSVAQTPPNFIAALDNLNIQKGKLRQAAEDVVTEIGELIPNL